MEMEIAMAMVMVMEMEMVIVATVLHQLYRPEHHSRPVQMWKLNVNYMMRDYLRVRSLKVVTKAANGGRDRRNEYRNRDRVHRRREGIVSPTYIWWNSTIGFVRIQSNE